MKITKKTYVSEILQQYVDIAEVMGIFGVNRLGGFVFRKFLTRFITVKIAAFVHRVPLQQFIGMLEVAIDEKK